MSVKCFDVADTVIDNASERFAPLWKINKDNLEIFKEYCETIDEIADEFEGESYEVEVDEISMCVTVALECGEIVITSPTHTLYDLIERTVGFSISSSDPDTITLKFTFPSLWERA